MKGIGAVVILIAMLIVGYLVVRDLGAGAGDPNRPAALEPLDRARDAADLVRRAQGSLQEALDRAER
ncbi:MAG: hypothetical protein Kow0092_20830 [Deferrisomatales bacterium]